MNKSGKDVFVRLIVKLFQACRWGRVAWAHELSQAELTARVAASLLVIQTASEQHSAKKKTSLESV